MFCCCAWKWRVLLRCFCWPNDHAWRAGRLCMGKYSQSRDRRNRLRAMGRNNNKRMKNGRWWWWWLRIDYEGGEWQTVVFQLKMHSRNSPDNDDYAEVNEERRTSEVTWWMFELAEVIELRLKRRRHWAWIDDGWMVTGQQSWFGGNEDAKFSNRVRDDIIGLVSRSRRIVWRIYLFLWWEYFIRTHVEWSRWNWSQRWILLVLLLCAAIRNSTVQFIRPFCSVSLSDRNDS